VKDHYACVVHASQFKPRERSCSKGRVAGTFICRQIGLWGFLVSIGCKSRGEHAVKPEARPLALHLAAPSCFSGPLLIAAWGGVQVPPCGGAAGGAGAGGPVPGGLGGRPGQAAGQPRLPRPVQPGEPHAALRTCPQAIRALQAKLWT
jgi:hypothetical protein